MSMPCPSPGAVRRRDPRSNPAPTLCFSVQAAAEPGVMPRVLELFAKRNLVPTRWHSAVVGPSGGELQIDIQVAGLAPEVSEYIARCLRQLVEVECVLTSVKTG